MGFFGRKKKKEGEKVNLDNKLFPISKPFGYNFKDVEDAIAGYTKVIDSQKVAIAKLREELAFYKERHNKLETEYRNLQLQLNFVQVPSMTDAQEDYIQRQFADSFHQSRSASSDRSPLPDDYDEQRSTEEILAESYTSPKSKSSMIADEIEEAEPYQEPQRRPMKSFKIRRENHNIPSEEEMFNSDEDESNDVGNEDGSSDADDEDDHETSSYTESDNSEDEYYDSEEDESEADESEEDDSGDGSEEEDSEEDSSEEYESDESDESDEEDESDDQSSFLDDLNTSFSNDSEEYDTSEEDNESDEDSESEGEYEEDSDEHSEYESNEDEYNEEDSEDANLNIDSNLFAFDTSEDKEDKDETEQEESPAVVVEEEEDPEDPSVEFLKKFGF